MIAILGKLLNIPALVRMRFCPMLNRALLKKKGAILVGCPVPCSRF